MLDWNDLRYFLAVARHGSTLAASRRLGASQATVSRRIGVLEETLGTALFVRSPAGYALAPRGAAILPLAEAVECAVDRLASAVDAERRRLSGEVRLTTVESAASAWVIPALRALRDCHPDIAVEIITTDVNLDLAHGEADVAIRFASRPTQESLIARHLTDLEESFYASRELVETFGHPAGFADLARFPLIVDTTVRGSGSVAWIERVVPGARIAQRVNTMSAMLSSVRAGLGAAVLPCLMGDVLRGAVRLLPPVPELTTPCWMVTTDAARRQPHIRAVIDHVVEHIERTTRATEAAGTAAGQAVVARAARS